MDLNLTQILVIGFFAANVSIPLVLFAVDRLLFFWTRKRFDTNLAFKFQMMKYKSLARGELDAAFYWMMVDLTVGMVLCLLLTCIASKYPIATPVSLACIAAFIFAPRFVVDVAHSVRYNFKTKDSDRIAKLEDELEKLKR